MREKAPSSAPGSSCLLPKMSVTPGEHHGDMTRITKDSATIQDGKAVLQTCSIRLGKSFNPLEQVPAL